MTEQNVTILNVEENDKIINDTVRGINSSYLLELINLLKSKSQTPLKPDELFRNFLIISCYTLIVIVSLFGNMIVVKVIFFGKEKMKTTTNILIASLAFSDILMTSLNIPFNVARLLLETWPFGTTLCVLVPFIQVTCVYVSTFTMTVIAFHRWWTLSRPSTLSYKLSSLRLGIIIAIVWSIAGILSVPHCIFNKTVSIPHDENLIRCRVVYPEMEFNFPLFLSVEAFLTQYLIPLSITCILYVKIGFVVSTQGQMATRSDDDRKKRQSEAKRRRIVMLILVVAVFAICWFPLNLHHLLVDYGIIDYNFRIFLACHWFAMSSVCYNPFIYCWLNVSFRKGARKLFRTILICFKHNQSQINTIVVNNNDENSVTYTTNVNHTQKEIIVEIELQEN